MANTATLFWGDRDAVLVDTLLCDIQSAELADWIEGKGRTLRLIYLTHAHPDHFFGLTHLLERFPEARAVARPKVVEAMHVTTSPCALEYNWKRRFPGLVPARLTVPQVLDEDHFELEGQEFRVIDLGHTNIDDTTGLHVPSLDLVIAGAAVYNETHPYLAETNQRELAAWLAALDRIEALDPFAIIAGHGPLMPDNDPGHIEATRQYILDFDRIDGETWTPRQLYEQMLQLYPDRANPGALWRSAHSAKYER